ncbi:LPXTG cell wall anchor domain-containing protein [Nocardiopsis sp. NPDC060348]|uniref:LPXTG cell wall anchor domain-containing protein n=1 Tax=Nocardiopsis sp. NPDC060348 TaxID=3347102 RepID=UPI00365E2476
MKNTRVTARRILQGSAAFAALGALSIATALPAAADSEIAGWARAHVAYGSGAADTYVTPQGQEDSGSNGGQFVIDDYLTIDASTTATVNANGASSTTTVNSARLVFTASDLGEILDQIEEEEENDEDDEGDGAGGDPSPSPSDGEGNDGDTGGDEGDGAGGDPSPSPSDGEGNDGDTGGDEGDGNDDEVGGGGTDSQDPVPTPSADPEVTTLSEENTELSSNGEEIVLDVTITGASVTTTQSWSGEEKYSYVEGTVSETVNEVDAKVGPPVLGEEGIHETDDAGYAWEDAHASLLLDFTVPEYFGGQYTLGSAYAGIGVRSTDNDGGTGGGDGGNDGKDEDEGDDKNPPNRDPETLPKPEPKATESLAQTGSPVGGLIAAGAAIAAGGGAAAYFARRKKNTAASAAETSEG